MDEHRIQLLLTDALLLDAVEGLDSIAGRLIKLYDDMRAKPAQGEALTTLGEALTELGWWRGRFEGAVSSPTATALGRASSAS